MVKEMSIVPKFQDGCLKVAFGENRPQYSIVFNGVCNPSIRFISVVSGVQVPAPPPSKIRGYGIFRDLFFVSKGCLLFA